MSAIYRLAGPNPFETDLRARPPRTSRTRLPKPGPVRFWHEWSPDEQTQLRAQYERRHPGA